VLETNGFSTCLATSDIKVDKMNVRYDRANGFVTFDLAGSSSREQKVKAVLTVTAYGKQVYEKTIDPCVQGIAQLCPCMLLWTILRVVLLFFFHFSFVFASTGWVADGCFSA